MKKLIVTTLIFFSLALTINAQEQAIKANPIGLAFGVANAGYEFATNDAQTLSISGLYYNISDVSGFGLGAEYRFYFSSNQALRGWHAGPAAGYFGLSDNFDNSAGFFSVGGEAGHQWIFGEHFLLDVFAGVTFITGNSESLNASFDSLAIGLGVSLGYAW